MQEAKAQLQKAKGMSNGFTPADEGFEEFRETYEQLPSEYIFDIYFFLKGQNFLFSDS